MSTYDAIIVGAGSGGLSTAAFLTRAGKRVVVLEQHDRPGGRCSAYREEGYLFDIALHTLVGGAHDDGLVGCILDEYGIRDRIEWHDIDPMLCVHMPGMDIALPTGIGSLRDRLVAAFPSSTARIERFLAHVLKATRADAMATRFLYGKSASTEPLYRDVSRMSWMGLPLKLAAMVRDRSTTGKQVLDAFFDDDKLKSVIAASWIALGAPPAELSGMSLSLNIAGAPSQRCYYPEGSSQVIADELMSCVLEHGGEVRFNTPVEAIIRDGATVTGVRLPGGEELHGAFVISNVDPRFTFDELMKPAPAPSKYLDRLKGMEPSSGPFKVYLGLDGDVAAMGMPHHDYVFFDSWDHDENYKNMNRGYPAALSCHVPTNASQTLAPAGHSTMVLTTMFPWETERGWREHGEVIAEEMLDIVARVAPTIREHIRVMKLFTPSDLRDFSNAHAGAMCGWQNSPDQTLFKRLPHKTPWRNLYLVGHWTVPGPGVSSAVASGWLLGKRLTQRGVLPVRLPGLRPPMRGSVNDALEGASAPRRLLADAAADSGEGSGHLLDAAATPAAAPEPAVAPCPRDGASAAAPTGATEDESSRSEGAGERDPIEREP